VGDGTPVNPELGAHAPLHKVSVTDTEDDWQAKLQFNDLARGRFTPVQKD